MRKRIAIGLILVSICIVVNTGRATQLQFNAINMQWLSGNFSNVHFNGAGNNFGGGIFWLNAKSLSGDVNIYFLWNTNNIKTCNKLIRGIYYNSQRGNRLRPLDTYTLSLLKATNANYNSLSMSWGLYTTCAGNENKYSIFWSISYNQSWTKSYIIAGTKLKYAQNIRSWEFAQSFQYFDNKTPLGYIRDSYWGIGFVGGELSGSNNLVNFLNGGGNINSGFVYQANSNIITVPTWATWIFSTVGDSAINTMWNLIVQGTIGLANNLNSTDKESLVGNQRGNSTIFNSSITNADISNQAKQYSEKLCKGKRKTLEQYTPLQLEKESTLCYKGDGNTLEIDLTQTNIYQNKTIIMQNGYIVLVGNMDDSSPPLDIYIDAGNLYLPSDLQANTFTLFDQQGFPVTSNGASAGRFLKGNIIINGLLIGGIPWNESSIHNKTHIQGKFFSLNSPFKETDKRFNQIIDLLGLGFTDYINLQNIFNRECQLGTGSDGTNCKYGNDISRVPLVILDRAFPSRLLK